MPLQLPLALFAVATLILICQLGSMFDYFNAVMALAARGRVKQEPTVNSDPVHGLRTCGHWLGCFLAGPAVLFGIALEYWIYSGDLSPMDWLIVSELGIAGVGWCMISLLLAAADETIRVPTPAQVLKVALRMRWKTVELTLLATAVLLGHFAAAICGIAQLHANPVSAVPLLWLCWTSGLYLATFTFRRLGLTYYRLMKERHRAAENAIQRPAFVPVLDGTAER